MNAIRKTIALFILIFIGIPILMGVIWAIGITRAAVSPEFLTDLPKEIITKIPVIMDESLKDIVKEDFRSDKNSKTWAEAFSRNKITLKELMEQTGIMNWLKNDLTYSLDELGKVLRGDIKPKPIMLNMRPLKEALKSEKLTAYLRETLQQLPPCTEEQAKEWIQYAEKNYIPTKGIHITDNFPACQPPDIDKAVELLRYEFIHEAETMPNEVNIFNMDNDPFVEDHAIDIIRFVTTMMYLLFLIPAAFIALASVIATSTGSGVLRWIGVSTLVGGAISFGLSKFGGRMFFFGMEHSYYYDNMHHVTHAERMFASRITDIVYSVFDRLFSSVDATAGIVCVVGIVLIAISYSFTRERKSENKPVPPAQPSQNLQSPTPQSQQ